jgi:putative toxin-antitoxin system antitoxin component (TIGR02293 family)
MLVESEGNPRKILKNTGNSSESRFSSSL